MKKIDSTRKIAPGSVLRLYKKGFGYAQATVIDLSGAYFAAAADRVFIDRVSDGERLAAYLWVENVASYEFSLTIAGRITVGEPAFIFNHTDAITRNRERRCLRVNVSMPVRFFVLDTGNEEKSVSTENIVHHAGVITELSDREAIVSSNDVMPLGTLVKLHIFIGARDLEIIARIEDVRSGNQLHHYFFSFMGLHVHDRKDLLDFIFGVYHE